MQGEELEMALNNVEQAHDAQLNQMAEQEFFDRYGSKFGNDKGLGLAILENLNAEGFDTSAADDAVQKIINQFREECTRTQNLLAENNQDVQRKIEENKIAADIAINELNKKADAMDKAVMEAAGSTGNQELASEVAQAAMEPTVPDNLGAGNAEVPPPPVEEPVPPAEKSVAAESPAPEGAAPIEPAQGEVQPETVPTVPSTPGEQPLGPTQIPSDERLKRIRSKLAARVNARRQQRNTTKLNSNIIEACGR